MKTIFSRALICLLAISQNGFGQAIFGDTENQTSLLLHGVVSGGEANSANFGKLGLLGLNFTEESATFNHFWLGQKHRFGFELKANTLNGFSSIFDGDSLSSELGGALFWGYKLSGTSEPTLNDQNVIVDYNPIFDGSWVTLRVGYTRADYNLLDLTAAVGSQLSGEQEDLFDFGIYYNKIWGGNLFGGVNVGYRRTSNFNKLTERTLQIQNTISMSGGSTVTETKEIKGREGALEVFNEGFLNADLLWIPQNQIWKNRLGLSSFLRVSHSDFEDLQFEPGIGVYLLRDGAPNSILGGITLQYDDTNSDWDVGFTTGFQF